MKTITLHEQRQRDTAKAAIDAAPAGAVVHISEAKEHRTDAQNRLIHKWFSDIEKEGAGSSFADIKADCNLTYGVPILTRDNPDWSAAFGYIFGALNRPAQIKALRVLKVPVTSQMGVKQLTEYMDQMQRDYAEGGIHLTDPEAMKYDVPQAHEGD